MGGSLELNELLEIKHFGDNIITNFVETGTYKAATTIMASTIFPHVFSTEIDANLYKEAVTKCCDIPNINLLFGDSLDMLKIILPNVTNGCVFFLDAHISGHDSSWNGTDRVPLMQELDIILSHKLSSSIFILDDVRFWKEQEIEAWDWGHVDTSSILDKFKSNGYSVVNSYIKNDRFFVFI